jgi:AmiR/NasT family two-component response regulator
MKKAENKSPELNQTILLVDDDPLILNTLTLSLENTGFIVHALASVDLAELWLVDNKPDLAILDVRMPNRNGLELTHQLELLQIPFILLTTKSDEETIKSINASGAMGYLVKPVCVSELLPTIRMAIARSQDIYALKSSEKNLKVALDSNRSIGIAVGIIMDQHLINHDEALKLIQNAARRDRTKLNDLACAIINARELLNLKLMNKPTSF